MLFKNRQEQQSLSIFLYPSRTPLRFAVKVLAEYPIAFVMYLNRNM